MIGDHVVGLTADSEVLSALQLTSFDPFEIESVDQSLFEVEIANKIEEKILEPVIVDAPISSSGMPRVDIYRIEDGFMYNVFTPRSSEVNATLTVNSRTHSTRIALHGNNIALQRMALNNAVILSYVSFAMEHDTLLLHASTVIHEGRAYLFLGKSGTGKSTHSRMWLEAFPTAELLNDDHPIVRTHADGSIIAYGSPWSGKTPCYRNLSAPLGAIIRIERALTNELVPLRPLKGFASITTSCSGAQWSKKLMDDKVHAIEKIVSLSKGYAMRCLPNVEAAEVCYSSIKAQE